MSDDKRERVPFGETLVGLQSVSAARGARYRAEMEKILVHRLSRSDRWVMALTAALLGTTMTAGGIAMLCAKPHPEQPGLDSARWAFAATCIASGLLLGVWLLRIAIQGGYARRLGDIVGLMIALVLSGGFALSLLQLLAPGINDANLRLVLLSVTGALLAIVAGCLVLTLLQRMHRQTQERLLRIEHQLAELLDHNAGGSSG